MAPRIPDLDECLRLMVQYEMLENIRRHSLMVAAVAERLVEGLSAGRAEILPRDCAPALVRAGALLHDIAKTPCLSQECQHAVLGGVICRELGYDEVAEIVEEHVILRRHEPERFCRGIFTAGEIVYYADKRVLHDQVVDLIQRRDYIIERYGGNDPLRLGVIEKNFGHCLELERALFSYLGFPPAELQCLDSSELAMETGLLAGGQG
ncbi:MAG: hypothetical protein BWK76_09835 [Desulfobulbaceae bacterium A2]|nr:MAG: hypothetical protein BWK76_09835 [Desulfobulbaceae bacterium A2]